MERDINVVAQVKEDGSVAFKTGDGFPLEMGGGKVMRNITIWCDAFLPKSIKAFVPNDPEGETGGHYVELKRIVENVQAGAALFGAQIPVGFPPSEITINFDSSETSDLDILFYKTIGEYSSQAGLTQYNVTSYNPENGVCVISLTGGYDYLKWLPSDIHIDVTPHIPG